ncbi:YciI family protein [Actinomadura chibensis]|uniref:YCII-related domain-containing protein n=1 Tax=Actinomadura chibensis TaxID=392828 RepID=A0A5D0NK30_9ACTN|nr:YciI family protein [Actinomadura chibensis]TYB44531.1 hypothetical protein FXF69_20435 [Actinomadura chibensis]
MEYFFYCRDRPGTFPLRMELAEAHWTFMDRYADELIARGPTFGADGETVTGSMHIADLPGPAAAREFAFEEPNYKAGVYDDVLIRRWRNVLGRTMWQFATAVPGYERFLVIAHGVIAHGAAAASGDDKLAEAQHRYLDGLYGDRLIAYGPLLSDDGADRTGTVLLVELPDRAAAETLMDGDPYARNGRYEDVEIHAWEFGGRR